MIALEFKLTEKQNEALGVSAGPSTHIMYFGGSRSGKTFLHCRNIMTRAIMAPGSRHLIARFRFNACKTAIALDTFPKMAKLCFPGVKCELDKTDWYFVIETGGEPSEVWIGGLDDKERVEKILGREYATVYLNECSQIPYASREVAMTRLAQRVNVVIDGEEAHLLPMRAYYDCNPPNKSHWTYKLFFHKTDPESGKPLPHPEDYAHIQMNPESNKDNLAPGYLAQLQAMSAMRRKRFYDGEFAEANPSALFTDDWIERWRVLDADTVPDLVRIVVAVDPSGADDDNNEGNDPIGIVAAGLGTDGNAYVLRDETVLAGPGTWGRLVCDLYEQLEADLIVGEQNFGGAMVKYVIRAQRRRVPFKMVTASRGKVQRAEPFSSLYEEGKVRHVGMFREMEDEMIAFSQTGYTGPRSPNRADALFWALAELFPSLVSTRKNKPQTESEVDMSVGAPDGWMA